MCKRHNRYFEEVKAIGFAFWQYENVSIGQVDVQRDICLFVARYSSKLKLPFSCGGCFEIITGRWYRCLHCIDMDLCASCYNIGKKPSDHLHLHEVIELRLIKVKHKFTRE